MKLSFQDWLLHQGFKVYSESGIQTSEVLQYNDYSRNTTEKKKQFLINNTIRKTKILVIHCSQKYRTTPILTVLYSCKPAQNTEVISTLIVLAWEQEIIT